MPNLTDLAAALNECMPIGEYTESHAVDDGLHLFTAYGGAQFFDSVSVIGSLWAECVRRGWHLELTCSTVRVSTTRNGRFDLHFQKPGTDALAFARAFAAAKKAGEA